MSSQLTFADVQAVLQNLSNSSSSKKNVFLRKVNETHFEIYIEDSIFSFPSYLVLDNKERICDSFYIFGTTPPIIKISNAFADHSICTVFDATYYSQGNRYFTVLTLKYN